MQTTAHTLHASALSPGSPILSTFQCATFEKLGLGPGNEANRHMIVPTIQKVPRDEAITYLTTHIHQFKLKIKILMNIHDTIHTCKSILNAQTYHMYVPVWFQV